MAPDEDALNRQILTASDKELIGMLLAGYGERGNAAIQTEMSRRLVIALDKSARAASRSANVLIVLTLILVFLTVVLIIHG